MKTISLKTRWVLLAAIAAVPEPTAVGVISQAESCSVRMNRLVVLSSTTSTRRPRSATGVVRRGRLGEVA